MGVWYVAGMVKKRKGSDQRGLDAYATRETKKAMATAMERLQAIDVLSKQFAEGFDPRQFEAEKGDLTKFMYTNRLAWTQGAKVRGVKKKKK